MRGRLIKKLEMTGDDHEDGDATQTIKLLEMLAGRIGGRPMAGGRRCRFVFVQIHLQGSVALKKGSRKDRIKENDR